MEKDFQEELEEIMMPIDDDMVAEDYEEYYYE